MYIANTYTHAHTCSVFSLSLHLPRKTRDRDRYNFSIVRRWESRAANNYFRRGAEISSPSPQHYAIPGKEFAELGRMFRAVVKILGSSSTRRRRLSRELKRGGPHYLLNSNMELIMITKYFDEGPNTRKWPRYRVVVFVVVNMRVASGRKIYDVDTHYAEEKIT